MEELGLVPTSVQVLHLIPDEQIGDIELSKKEKFLDLLDEFEDIFAKDEFDLGKAKGINHKIDIKDHEPQFQHAYRQSPAANQIFQEEVD